MACPAFGLRAACVACLSLFQSAAAAGPSAAGPALPAAADRVLLETLLFEWCHSQQDQVVPHPTVSLPPRCPSRSPQALDAAKGMLYL